MQRFFAFQWFPAVLALLLTACGGGSGGSSSPAPPVATHLSVAAPASIAAGTAFNFTVTALDASNNIMTSYAGRVYLTSTDEQAVLNPFTATLINGTGTFSATLKTPGAQTIAATDLVASIAGTSNSINIAGMVHFKTTGTMGVARASHTATILNGGEVLITGGNDGMVVLSSTEVFDPASGSFTQSGSMHSARGSHTATLLDHGTPLMNGKVLITGGSDATNTRLWTVELYTPSTGAFTAMTQHLINARSGHTATSLTSGQVLITGGDAAGTTAELFDPGTGTFAATRTPMQEPRSHHQATLLSSGKVLISGGATLELFDPTTGSFTTIEHMYSAVRGGTATWLNGENVLIAGGQRNRSGTIQPWCEIVAPGPVSGFGSNMLVARIDHTATRRPDGTVLVVGGSVIPPLSPICGSSCSQLQATLSAELFDSSQTFVHTSNMTFARVAHTATLLKDGDVLVTGGRDAGGNTLATAELYH